jgi:hypothetical protein
MHHKRVLALIKKKKRKKKKRVLALCANGQVVKRRRTPAVWTVVENCYKGPITWMGLTIKALQEETL